MMLFVIYIALALIITVAYILLALWSAEIFIKLLRLSFDALDRHGFNMQKNSKNNAAKCKEKSGD